MWSFDFSTKEPRQLNGERKVFSTNGARQNEHPPVKKIKLLPNIIYINLLKVDHIPNVGAKTIKCLLYKHRSKYIRLGKEFLGMTSKVQYIKEVLIN